MKVLVATGRSGGHIFPAISFIEEFKARQADADILLVLPKKAVNSGNIPALCRIEFTSVTNIEFSLSAGGIKSALNLLKGALKSFYLLISFKPDIVVGFGSLNSAPFILLAWLMRIQTLIHEQNVIPGRANKFLSRLCDKTAISFERTSAYLPVSAQRLLVTGNPIRRQLRKTERKEALGFFGFDEGKFTVMASGGSQASARINECLLKALPGMPDIGRLQVIHLCGSRDIDCLNKAYKELGIRARLFTFLDKIHYAYSIADLAVTRAGASTISELIEFCVPAIIIPYPFAREHQKANAAMLKEAGCAIVIDDDGLSPQSLRQEVSSFISDPGKCCYMRRNYAKFQTANAAGLLVDAVLSLSF